MPGPPSRATNPVSTHVLGRSLLRHASSALMAPQLASRNLNPQQRVGDAPGAGYRRKVCGRHSLRIGLPRRVLRQKQALNVRGNRAEVAMVWQAGT